MSDLFNVGQIVNTHGIKGELKVIPLTDDVNNFKRYKKLLVDDIWREVKGVKFQKDRVILKLEGIETINEAETFKTKYLYTPRSEEPELEENEDYVCDIIGSKIYDSKEKFLGEVFDVISTKNNDVYWIKEPKELLIPVLPDIVLDVSVEDKKIIIRPVGEWQDED